MSFLKATPDVRDERADPPGRRLRRCQCLGGNVCPPLRDKAIDRLSRTQRHGNRRLVCPEHEREIRRHGARRGRAGPFDAGFFTGPPKLSGRSGRTTRVHYQAGATSHFVEAELCPTALRSELSAPFRECLFRRSLSRRASSSTVVY